MTLSIAVALWILVKIQSKNIKICAQPWRYDRCSMNIDHFSIRINCCSIYHNNGWVTYYEQEPEAWTNSWYLEACRDLFLKTWWMICRYNVDKRLMNENNLKFRWSNAKDDGKRRKITSYLGATPVYRTRVNCKQTKWPPTQESSTWDKGGWSLLSIYYKLFVFPCNFTSIFMQLIYCVIFIGIYWDYCLCISVYLHTG